MVFLARLQLSIFIVTSMNDSRTEGGRISLDIEKRVP